MGIKKVKYREKQKESNKRLMFSYKVFKEINAANEMRRKKLSILRSQVFN